MLLDTFHQVLPEDLPALQETRGCELGGTTSLLAQQGLDGELVIRSLDAVLEGGDVALLAEGIRLGVHGFDLAHIALFKALAYHLLNTLLDFSKGDGLRAIVKHAHDGVHAAEHLGQHLILVR